MTRDIDVFVAQENGGVTPDWTVLAAGFVGLALAVTGTISPAIETSANSLRHTIVCGDVPNQVACNYAHGDAIDWGATNGHLINTGDPVADLENWLAENGQTATLDYHNDNIDGDYWHVSDFNGWQTTDGGNNLIMTSSIAGHETPEYEIGYAAGIQSQQELVAGQEYTLTMDLRLSQWNIDNGTAEDFEIRIGDQIIAVDRASVSNWGDYETIQYTFIADNTGPLEIRGGRGHRLDSFGVYEN